jgi:hypothetical protein
MKNKQKEWHPATKPLKKTEVGTAVTAETLATAGTPGTSTAVKTTTAAGSPATAETITTAGTQGKPTAAITSNKSQQQQQRQQDHYGMLATSGMLTAIGTPATAIPATASSCRSEPQIKLKIKIRKHQLLTVR